MDLGNSTSREKKTLTYKEQCPEKRRAYLDAFDLEVQGGGKTPVYIDENGFPSSNLRRYAYDPKRSASEIKYRVHIGMNPFL
jgi:hypothetical protein